MSRDPSRYAGTERHRYTKGGEHLRTSVRSVTRGDIVVNPDTGIIACEGENRSSGHRQTHRMAGYRIPAASGGKRAGLHLSE